MAREIIRGPTWYKNPGGRCTVPFTVQLNLFYNRLPKVVKLLEDELNKY